MPPTHELNDKHLSEVFVLRSLFCHNFTKAAQLFRNLKLNIGAVGHNKLNSGDCLSPLVWHKYIVYLYTLKYTRKIWGAAHVIIFAYKPTQGVTLVIVKVNTVTDQYIWSSKKNQFLKVQILWEFNVSGIILNHYQTLSLLKPLVLIPILLKFINGKH